MPLIKFAFFFLLLFSEPSCLFTLEKRINYHTEIYEATKIKLPRGEVSYVNGMNHKPERAKKCAGALSELAGGYNVFLIYNPTGGFLRDITKCFKELYRFKVTPPVRKLHEKWTAYFSNAKPHDTCLQFCHSQGCIQVRNALLCYPPHLRKRIHVVAIAPAAYIPEEICGSCKHYVSRRDIVPKLDRPGKKRCASTTVILTPHPDAAFFDHHFLSPTYHPAIHTHLQNYLKKNL